MARLGKQISSPPSTPIARRLHAMASRNESSHTNYKWQRTDRRRTDRRRKDKRPVAKMNYGIVGKIVLVLIVALLLLIAFLMLR